MYRMEYRRKMLGKIIGAFFGFLFLRSLFGVLLGLMVGNLFDRGFRFGFRAKLGNSRRHQSSHVQKIYFKSTFMVMGNIAKADGRVTEDEIRVARSVMAKMQLSEEKKREAIHYFNVGKQASFRLEPVLTELFQSCRQQRLLLRMFVEIQFQAAMANRYVDPSQRRILEQICKRLGITPFFSQYQSYSQQQHSQYSYNRRAPIKRDTLQQAYSLLEIPQTATQAEVKKAYRKLMSQHHPDKLMAKGLPEEMIKIATDKTQKIRAAYEEIKKARGF